MKRNIILAGLLSLFVANIFGMEEQIIKLMEDFKFVESADFKETPLEKAIFEGDLLGVAKLIGEGVDVNSGNSLILTAGSTAGSNGKQEIMYKTTPLLLACTRGGYNDGLLIVALLLAVGADPLAEVFNGVEQENITVLEVVLDVMCGKKHKGELQEVLVRMLMVQAFCLDPKRCFELGKKHECDFFEECLKQFGESFLNMSGLVWFQKIEKVRDFFIENENPQKMRFNVKKVLEEKIFDEGHSLSELLKQAFEYKFWEEKEEKQKNIWATLLQRMGFEIVADGSEK